MSYPDIKKCFCGGVLGVQLDAENFEQRHQGRTTKFNGQGSITITCEDCKRTTLVRLEGAGAAVV